MPTLTSSGPSRRTEKASSISLVPMSSRLKAGTSASGRPSGIAAGGGGGDGRAARKNLVEDAVEVVLVGVRQQPAGLEGLRRAEAGLLGRLLEGLGLGLCPVR